MFFYSGPQMTLSLVPKAVSLTETSDQLLVDCSQVPTKMPILPTLVTEVRMFVAGV